MSPRRFEAVAFPILSLVIVFLLLNLGETDTYLFGSEEPLEPVAFSRGIEHLAPTREVVCKCACEHCHHIARVTSAVAVFRVVDSDGWYRLFWAGDDVYYFNDLSYFLTALENRTWREADGILSVTIDYEKNCPPWEPEHECESRIPVRVRLEYHLAIEGQQAPVPGTATGPEGRVRFPRWIPEALRRFEAVFRGKVYRETVSVGWVLDESSIQVEYGPCRCP